MTGLRQIDPPGPQELPGGRPVRADALPAKHAAGPAYREEPPVGWQAPLLDLASTVARRWQLFALVLTLGVTFGIGQYLLTRPFYGASATAKLMPREKPPVDLKLRNGTVETSSDTATRGETGSMMLPADVALYTSIARSQSVLASLAQRFLARMERFERIPAEDAASALRDLVSIHGDENGLITVDVVAHDPALAADLANAIVAEMNEASKKIEAGLLEQQTASLTAAVQISEQRLADAQAKLAAFLALHDIVDLKRELENSRELATQAELKRRSLIEQRAERLASFTPNDPIVRSLDAQIADATDYIQQLRDRPGGGVSDLDRKELANLLLTNERLENAVRNENDMLSTLEGQQQIYEYRAMQMDGSIALIKAAEPQPQRAGPSKKNTIGASVLIALFLAILVVVLREQWTRVEHEPYLARRAEEVRTQVRVLAPAWLLDAARRTRGRSR